MNALSNQTSCPHIIIAWLMSVEASGIAQHGQAILEIKEAFQTLRSETCLEEESIGSPDIRKLNFSNVVLQAHSASLLSWWQE